MNIMAPAWLILLIPATIITYIYRPPTRFLTLARTLTFLLIIIAMCRPAFRLHNNQGTVIVIADRSASMQTGDLHNQTEIIHLLSKSITPGKKLAVIAFGRSAILEHAPQSASFSDFKADTGPDRSNLDLALQKALAIIPAGQSGRIIILSDGRYTGTSPYASATRLAARNLAIDFRLQSKPAGNDLAIDSIAAPKSLNRNEAFIITSWIKSPASQNATYQLSHNKHIIAKGKTHLKTGLNRLVFRDRAGSAGTQTYTLTINGSLPDSTPQNNQARMMVGIHGQKPILCISTTKTHALSKLLKKGRINIHTTNPNNTWTIEQLSNFSSLILENTAASQLGKPAMELIASWIENSGAGLMMTGGKNSFAPGGYFHSPLEHILPVSMELRKEHRKFSLAVAIVMDRSGSMMANAGNGKTKMDLANIGAVQVLDLLSDMDEIGVIAVDSTAHIITPLKPVANNRSQRGKILKIESTGGGIFIYQALQAASRMLLKSQSQTRHIILFADAADSEEPGQYTELLQKCAAANITCSVIGLGTESDCDAALLRDIARMGDGRSFFTADAMEIPRLFAQDTFAVARSAIVDEPTTIKFTAGINQIANLALPSRSSPTIAGYNLCYIRPGATPAAISSDEYTAPIIAFWQAGRGRVIAYTAEADGKYTGPIANWPHTGQLLASLTRWIAGSNRPLPNDIIISQTIDSGNCKINIHLDPNRIATPFNATPTITLLHGTPGTAPHNTTITMQWKNADLLSGQFELYGNETALPTVHIQNQRPVTLTPSCLPYSPEYRPAKPGHGFNTLRRLAKITGGKERGDVTSIWNELPRQIQYIEISHWLYILATIILIIDILQRRTGLLSNLHIPRQRTNRQTNTKKTQPKKNTAPKNSKRTKSSNPTTESTTHSQKKTPPKKEPDSTSNTLSALQEARRRAKNRNTRTH